MLPFLITNPKTRKELQVIQNRCLKIILNLPIRTNTLLIHNYLHIDLLDKRVKSLVSNYLIKAAFHNKTIKEINNSYRV